MSAKENGGSGAEGGIGGNGVSVMRECDGEEGEGRRDGGRGRRDGGRGRRDGGEREEGWRGEGGERWMEGEGKGLMAGEGTGLIEGMWCWASSLCLGRRSSRIPVVDLSSHALVVVRSFPAHSLSASSCRRPVLL